MKRNQPGSPLWLIGATVAVVSLSVVLSALYSFWVVL